MDYDIYLKEKDKAFTTQPLAVLLDECVPFHPDYRYKWKKPPISAEKYFHLLNNFFKRIENELGFEVIIAAHPRSRYEDHPGCFKGRKWQRGRTISLVKESSLVLAHNSTSLSFANLFNKPVIFLTSSEMDKSWQGSFIRAKSEWFGKKPIFMDGNSPVDWKQELKINRNRYQEYREAYIKTDSSPDLPFWQIVADRLKKGE
jgi:hypothetical protein